MNQEEIKRHRVESLLREIIPEALATLDDPMLHGLLVTEVICSRGRSDAKVYLDKSFFDQKEQNQILSRLRKVAPYVQNHCKQSEGWFRAPRLKFEFDEQPQKQSRMEELFRQISQKKGDDAGE